MKRVINLKDNLSEESIKFLFQNFSIIDEKVSFFAENPDTLIVLYQDGTAKIYTKGDILVFKSYQNAADFLMI
jgi:hypothetical protein